MLSAEKEDAKIRAHHTVKTWCAESSAGTDCDPFATFQRAVKQRGPDKNEASIVYADLTAAEWLDEAGTPPVLALLTKLRPKTLLLPVRISPLVAESAQALAHLKGLLEHYNVVSVHVGVHQAVPTEVTVGGVKVPSELQLTLVPKASVAKKSKKQRAVATKAAAASGDDPLAAATADVLKPKAPSKKAATADVPTPHADDAADDADATARPKRAKAKQPASTAAVAASSEDDVEVPEPTTKRAKKAKKPVASTRAAGEQDNQDAEQNAGGDSAGTAQDEQEEG
jgi:hypothetical protein